MTIFLKIIHLYHQIPQQFLRDVKISIVTGKNDYSSSGEIMGTIFSMIFMLWITYLVIYFTDVINRKAWLDRGKWAVIKWQALITLFLVLSLVVAIAITSIVK